MTSLKVLVFVVFGGCVFHIIKAEACTLFRKLGSTTVSFSYGSKKESLVISWENCVQQCGQNMNCAAFSVSNRTRNVKCMEFFKSEQSVYVTYKDFEEGEIFVKSEYSSENPCNSLDCYSGTSSSYSLNTDRQTLVRTDLGSGQVPTEWQSEMPTPNRATTPEMTTQTSTTPEATTPEWTTMEKSTLSTTERSTTTQMPESSSSTSSTPTSTVSTTSSKSNLWNGRNP